MTVASTRPASSARVSFAAERLLMIASGAQSVVLHSPSLLPSARPSPAEYQAWSGADAMITAAAPWTVASYAM